MKAKIYKLGKSSFAITRPAPDTYMVFQLVRGKWTHEASQGSLERAQLFIFHSFVKDGGMVTI